MVVSAALIGAAVGSLLAGQLADRIGPGKALLWNNVLLLVGSLLCAVSPGGIWAAVIGKSTELLFSYEGARHADWQISLKQPFVCTPGRVLEPILPIRKLFSEESL